jgi:hypothetical protein
MRYSFNLIFPFDEKRRDVQPAFQSVIDRLLESSHFCLHGKLQYANLIRKHAARFNI